MRRVLAGAAAALAVAGGVVIATQLGSSPSGLTLLSATERTVTVGWTAADNVVGYTLYSDGRKVATAGKAAVSAKFGVTYGQHVLGIESTDKAGLKQLSSVTVENRWRVTSTSYPPPPIPPTTTTTPMANWKGSFDASYSAAPAGSTVTVPCGVYDDTTFTSRNPAGSNVIFEPATPFCATVRSLNFTSGGDYATFRDFKITATDGAIYQGGSTPLRGVVLDHNQIAVNQSESESVVNFHTVDGLQFVNNTIGPVCCGLNGNGPVGLRIGIPTGAPNSTHVLIDGNTIQGTVRNCTYWPATYKLGGQTLPSGPCPGVTCPACHEDGIQIWGMTDSKISNNRVEGVEVQGIYIEPTNGSLNSNIDITGNTVTVVGGNAGIYVKVNDVANTGGTWNITNNTTPNLIHLGAGFTGALPGTVFNLVSNTAELLISDASGNNAGCTGYPSTVKINYSGNHWLPVGGSTDGCG